MGLFSRFSKKKKVIKDESLFLGGDGLTAENPVYINCASVGMAQTLIDIFISKIQGEKGIDWEMGTSYTLKSDKTKCGLIKKIIVKTEHEDLNYFFDLSRSVALMQKFL